MEIERCLAFDAHVYTLDQFFIRWSISNNMGGSKRLPNSLSRYELTPLLVLGLLSAVGL